MYVILHLPGRLKDLSLFDVYCVQNQSLREACSMFENLRHLVDADKQVGTLSDLVSASCPTALFDSCDEFRGVHRQFCCHHETRTLSACHLARPCAC
jgi:hypothetical protein